MITDWSTPLGPGIRWVWWPVEMLVRWNVFTGEEDLRGAQGEALDDIGGGRDGLVRVVGKQWRATIDQKIPHGQNICVIGNDGLNLRVEAGPALKSKEELLDAEIAQSVDLLRAGDTALMRYRLGTLYERKGDLQTASEQYRLAEKLDPNIRATYKKVTGELD